MTQPEPANDPTSWDMLEQLYFEGQNLDAAGREQLVAPFRAEHPELIKELEGLWAHKPRGKSLFETLPRISRSFWQGFAGEAPPEQIGAYQVIEELGRGGMGVVYKALQPPPLSRQVAVKVLPAGLHAPSWRARFEMEQQSLSAMNHAHIATVHDAGLSPENQPYLVMELLDGLPITRYCDTHQLSIEDRLALFVQVCEGVNHAHRKGIIHRDLKPSNVLVIEQDGHHVPKIIDFGIAGSLDLSTPVTQSNALGTPAYMSPEQVMGQKDKVDTRSDIYSLGALLFELLAGKAPLDARLRQVSGSRARCEVVRDHAPQPLGQQVDALITAQVAEARAETPTRLAQRLKGELHWICSKAMARNPEDRYGSCSQLVEDLHRLRQNRPVIAAPDGAWYPLKKWFATHRLLVGSGLASLTALVIALFISLFSLRAVTASKERLATLQAYSLKMVEAVNPFNKGREVKVFEVLDDAAKRIDFHYKDQPELERSIRQYLAVTYRDLGLYADAEVQFKHAFEKALLVGRRDDEEVLTIMGDRAYNLFLQDQRERANATYRDAVALAEKRLGWRHPLSLELSSGYGIVLGALGQREIALSRFEHTLDGQQETLGFTHPNTIATTNNLADLLLGMELYPEVAQRINAVLANYPQVPGGMDLQVASLQHNLALAYVHLGRVDEAIEMGRRVLATRKKLLGDDHRDTLRTANNLITAIGKTRPASEVIHLLRETLATLPERAEGSNDYLRLRHNLGHYLKEAKGHGEAEALLEDTWGKRKELLGEDHADTLKTRFTLGEVFWETDRHTKALEIFEDVVEQAEKSLDMNQSKRNMFRNALKKYKQQMDQL